MKKIPISLGTFRELVQECFGKLSDKAKVRVEQDQIYGTDDAWLVATDSDGKVGKFCLFSTVRTQVYKK